MHYLAIESCRQVLRPNEIYLHYHNLPFGSFWDEIRPHLTLHRVNLAEEVATADFDEQFAPAHYRYAHHADFIRLDALLEFGGIYADIDTVFLRPLPDTFYDEQFVIGREPPVQHELTGKPMPSLCNALLISEPGAAFATAWRSRMGAAIDGTWSNHSCFLPQALSEELPHAVRVEPEESFFAVPGTVNGLAKLLDDGTLDLPNSYSVHLWAHLWWDYSRTDFSNHYAGEFTLRYLADAQSPLAKFLRPYLPDMDLDDLRAV